MVVMVAHLKGLMVVMVAHLSVAPWVGDQA